MMIVWSCEFGKDREQERKHQLGAVMAGIYRRYKPHDLPLFQARLAGIISDYARQGVFFEGEASTEAAVWAQLQKTPFSAVGLSRCNLNRFMGSLHTAMHRSMRWSIDRFERETLGLEYDMLHSAKLLKKVNFAPLQQDDVAEEGGSTNTHKLQFDDRQSMAFATNAVITSNVMLARPENKRIVDIIVESTRPVLVWHTEQHKVLRAADASEQWLLHQLAGCLLKHVEAIMFAVGDQNVLEACGFQTRAGGADALHDVDILTEDEFATLLGQHCLLQASCRLRRTLHTTQE
jgi:hypothetical protein